MRRFAEKVVLVTGAAVGLGEAIAEAFAQEGARLVLADIDAAGAAKTCARVTALGVEAIAVTADVSNRASVKAMIDAAIAAFGRLDIAINNAGAHEPPRPFLETDDQTFERVIGVNLRGMWLCLQAEIATMLPHAGGAIVNITSVTDCVGSPFASVYVASKHGALGLTRSTALEFAQSGIRINAVSPAGMYTPMFAEAARENPDFVTRGNAAHPIGRIADTGEVARAVLFLASDEASYIIGHSLKVDGGYTAA